MKKNWRRIKVLLLLCFLVFISQSGCKKMHYEIYGEQSITIINNLNSSVSVTIHSINGSDSKSLGTVAAQSRKTFDLNWRNDCHFDFTAYAGLYGYNTDYLDVCGGST